MKTWAIDSPIHSCLTHDFPVGSRAWMRRWPTFTCTGRLRRWLQGTCTLSRSQEIAKICHRMELNVCHTCCGSELQFFDFKINVIKPGNDLVNVPMRQCGLETHLFPWDNVALDFDGSFICSRTSSKSSTFRLHYATSSRFVKTAAYQFMKIAE